MNTEKKLPETKASNKIGKLLQVLLALSPAIYGIIVIVTFRKGAPSAASIAEGIVRSFLALGCIGLSVVIFIIWGIVASKTKDQQAQNQDDQTANE